MISVHIDCPAKVIDGFLQSVNCVLAPIMTAALIKVMQFAIVVHMSAFAISRTEHCRYIGREPIAATRNCFQVTMVSPVVSENFPEHADRLGKVSFFNKSIRPAPAH